MNSKSRRYKLFSRVAPAILSVCLGVYSTHVLAQSAPNTPTLSEQLNWDAAEGNRCGGSYQVPPLTIPATGPLSLDAPIKFSADQSQVDVQGAASFWGNVSAVQPGRELTADKIVVVRDSQAKKFKALSLSGNVSLRTQHNLLRGEKAFVNLETQDSWITRAIFRLTSAATPGITFTEHTPVTLWGQADKITQYAQKKLVLDRARVSACAPTHPFWQIRANTVVLNRTTGWGSAYHAKFYVHDVPVMYTPYMSFPIDNSRKTGFLFPLVAHNSRSGLDVSLPFYWNIAPNYDATLTPRYLRKRGLFTQAQFRYLSRHQHGEFQAGLLAHDNAFQQFRNKNVARLFPVRTMTPGYSALSNANTRRHFLSWQHHASRGNWFADVDYTEVSDDYMLHDLGGLSLTTTNSQLLQQGQVGYHGPHWLFATRWQRYQALQRFDRPLVAEQYRRLPQITLSGNWVEPRHGVHLGLDSEWVHFERFKNPLETASAVSAHRTVLAPRISWPMTWGLYGYLTPEIQVHATQYQLKNQMPGVARYQTRVLPIASVDAGLSFERSTTWFSHPYNQTLEPRLFALWVPYHSQSDIPTFDTSLNIFNYDQLFRWNRFNGIDRINDAKQLAWSLTSRFMQPSDGAEAFRVSIGQLIYFKNRRVRLCETGLCDENTQLAERYELPNDVKLSPLVAMLRYAFHSHWYITAHGAYDVVKHANYSEDFYLHYQPADNHLFNLGFTYLHNGDILPSTTNRSQLSSNDDLKQAEVSAAWPLSKALSLVGRYQYNLSHRHLQSTFAGLEYHGCCWALRVVAGKAFKRLDEQNHERYDPAVFVQWQFTGLGNVGNKEPTHLLTEGIRGYRDAFAVRPLNFAP